jgi:hypothetical protein
MTDCSVSWLRLEQFALGELADLGEHVATCPDCVARLEAIRGDVRPLPALPSDAGRRAANRWWIPVVALAAAALIALLPRSSPRGYPGPEIRVKGGTLAVSVVRERHGEITADPATYADGDRIQVRVTCPPGDSVEVVILSEGRAALPLGSPACGNGVVAGAIRLTGAATTAVCAVAGVPRDELERRGAAAFGETAACAVLRAEGGR